VNVGEGKLDEVRSGVQDGSAAQRLSWKPGGFLPGRRMSRIIYWRKITYMYAEHVNAASVSLKR